MSERRRSSTDATRDRGGSGSSQRRAQLDGSGRLTRLAQYQVQAEIARGGMAIIYRAVDPDGRTVALKVLREQQVRTEQVQRLKREAAVCTQLVHPNIVPVLDVGVALDTWGEPTLHYIAMEYVQGRTLAELMEGAGPPADWLGLMEEIARGVGFAHSRGVTHRDLKPSNILIRDGHALVADFGLARWEEDSQLTRTGQMLGTPHYMSPEQVLGRIHEVGPPSDVWALGVLLYEMLTGRRPFASNSPDEAFMDILYADPQPPRALAAEVPASLESVCLKALQKVPADRYATGEELARELQRYREGRPVLARAPSRWRRVRRWTGWRSPFLLGLAATLAVVGVAALLVFRTWQAERRTFDGHANAARAAYADSDWGGALLACERALALRPDDTLEALAGRCREQLATVEEQRARSRARAERYGVLQRRLQPLVRKVEEVRQLRYISGLRIERNLSDLAEVVSEVQALAGDAGYSGFAELWTQLGMAYWLLDRPGPARTALARALELDAGDGRARYHLARILVRRMLTESAVATEARSPQRRAGLRVEAARALDWNWAGWRGEHPIDAHTARTLRAAVADDREALVRLCEEGLARFRAMPRSEIYWVLRAQLGRGQQRLKDLAQAIAQRPHDGWLYFLRGAARRRAGLLEAAITDQDRALARRPGLAAAHLDRGLARAATGQAAGARRDFDRALELDARLAAAHHERGRLRQAAGDQAGALADIDRGLDLAPDMSAGWWRRGQVLQAMGRPALAIQAQQRATRLDPRRWQSWEALARLQAASGRRDVARDAIARALEHAPTAETPRLKALAAELGR